MHFLVRLILCLLLPTAVMAQTEPTPQAPQLPVRSYILMDFYGGNTLAEVDAQQPLDPASITKLMTAYVVYQSLREGHIQLSDQVTISEKAWRMKGSRMFIEVGSQVSVDDLIMGMVVQSGNDATVALAEHVAGSEESFVTLMNQQATRLGLTESHFVNSTGWPEPNHHMSARDIAMLTRALIKEFPEQYRRYSIREYVYNNITQHNRNRLLWQDESVDGVKTGHTEAAGFCLASSAKRGDARLIAVVLGAEKKSIRFSASQSLLNYGFRFFETHKLYDAGQALIEGDVWKGDEGSVPLGPLEDFYVTVPKGRYDEMQASLQVTPNVEAPIQQGTAMGSIVVTLGDKTIADTPLVALQDVAEGGFLGNMVDEIVLMIKSLFD